MVRDRDSVEMGARYFLVTFSRLDVVVEVEVDEWLDAMDAVDTGRCGVNGNFEGRAEAIFLTVSRVTERDVR
jgi:hypothetical protein